MDHDSIGRYQKTNSVCAMLFIACYVFPLCHQVESIEDAVQSVLRRVGKEEVASEQLKKFKKRKLISNV